MLRDFRYAYRLLRKSPVTTLVTVLALALGIGANTGTFIAVNAILLRPFSYPNLARIVTVWEKVPKLGLDQAGVAPANFADWNEQSRSFEQLAAYRSWNVNITAAERPQAVDAARVTPAFFRVFGTQPKLGRTFTDGEGQSGNDRVVILSEAFWRTRFSAERDITGKTISLGGQNHTIVGVMPDEFEYPLGTEMWVPLTFTEAEKTDRIFHDLLVVGLLKPDVRTDESDAELATIARTLALRYPNTNEGWSAAVMPLSQMTERVTDRFLSVLAIAALFLLLLAGANVANIQLARATGQRKTIAIEAALGASRFRIARLLCAESILLAVAGGFLGLLAAAWLNDFNRTSIPALVYHLVPGIRNLRVDSTVVSFTLALSLVTGVLCSLPAIIQLLGKHSSPVLTETLNQGSRSLAADTRSSLRNILVICEVAIALLLLVGAGVMINTFQHMLTLNLGFNTSNLLRAEISLPKADYSENRLINGFYDRLLPELSAIPGVKSVSVMGGMGRAIDFFIEGRAQSGVADLKPEVRAVDERYFRTMEIPMIRGRAIAEQDRNGSTPVVVISKRLAEFYWPGLDPIGKRIRWGPSPWSTIVGVSGDTKDWFMNVPEPAAYVPYRQVPRLYMQLFVRTDVDPLRTSNAILARVRAADPSEPIHGIKTMEQMLAEERSGVESAARMMRDNAAVALLLAITGIYGVISYFVSQRTKEIGIRIALGAANPDILKLTLGQACRVAGIGLLIGVPAAYILMRVLSSVLYNVMVVKWTTFSGVTVLLALAALFAAYIPARRATAIDPVIALRNE